VGHNSLAVSLFPFHHVQILSGKCRNMEAGHRESHVGKTPPPDLTHAVSQSIRGAVEGFGDRDRARRKRFFGPLFGGGRAEAPQLPCKKKKKIHRSGNHLGPHIFLNRSPIGCGYTAKVHRKIALMTKMTSHFLSFCYCCCNCCCNCCCRCCCCCSSSNRSWN